MNGGFLSRAKPSQPYLGKPSQPTLDVKPQLDAFPSRPTEKEKDPFLSSFSSKGYESRYQGPSDARNQQPVKRHVDEFKEEALSRDDIMDSIGSSNFQSNKRPMKKESLSGLVESVSKNIAEEERKWIGLQILAFFKHLLEKKDKNYQQLQQNLTEFVERKMDLELVKEMIDHSLGSAVQEMLVKENNCLSPERLKTYIQHGIEKAVKQALLRNSSVSKQNKDEYLKDNSEEFTFLKLNDLIYTQNLTGNITVLDINLKYVIELAVNPDDPFILRSAAVIGDKLIVGGGNIIIVYDLQHHFKEIARIKLDIFILTMASFDHQRVLLAGVCGKLLVIQVQDLLCCMESSLGCASSSYSININQASPTHSPNKWVFSTQAGLFFASFTQVLSLPKENARQRLRSQFSSMQSEREYEVVEVKKDGDLPMFNLKQEKDEHYLEGMNVKTALEFDLNLFAAIVVRSTKIYIVDNSEKVVRRAIENPSSNFFPMQLERLRQKQGEEEKHLCLMRDTSSISLIDLSSSEAYLLLDEIYCQKDLRAQAFHFQRQLDPRSKVPSSTIYDLFLVQQDEQNFISTITKHQFDTGVVKEVLELQGKEGKWGVGLVDQENYEECEQNAREEDERLRNLLFKSLDKYILKFNLMPTLVEPFQTMEADYFFSNLSLFGKNRKFWFEKDHASIPHHWVNNLVNTGRQSLHIDLKGAVGVFNYNTLEQTNSFHLDPNQQYLTSIMLNESVIVGCSDKKICKYSLKDFNKLHESTTFQEIQKIMKVNNQLVMIAEAFGFVQLATINNLNICMTTQILPHIVRFNEINLVKPTESGLQPYIFYCATDAGLHFREAYRERGILGFRKCGSYLSKMNIKCCLEFIKDLFLVAPLNQRLFFIIDKQKETITEIMNPMGKLDPLQMFHYKLGVRHFAFVRDSFNLLLVHINKKQVFLLLSGKEGKQDGLGGQFMIAEELETVVRNESPLKGSFDRKKSSWGSKRDLLKQSPRDQAPKKELSFMLVESLVGESRIRRYIFKEEFIHLLGGL